MSTTPTEDPTQQPPAYVGEPAAAPYTYAPQGAQTQLTADAPYAPQASAATTLSGTNTYALVGVILTFVVPIAGIIFGHLGLNQIKRTGDAGRGLALTAVIYGYCTIALGILFAVLYIGFIAVMFGAMADGYSNW